MAHIRGQKEFCECGGSIGVAGKGSDAMMDVWRRYHSGIGHEERVTALEADKIRWQNRRAATRSK